MAQFVNQYAPNRLLAKAAPGATGGWYVVASDGATATTVAGLTALGKKPFPNLDPGLFLQTLTAVSEAAAGGAGGPFYIAINPQTAPTTTAQGRQILSGEDFSYAGPVWQVWVWLTAATDKIDLQGAY